MTTTISFQHKGQTVEFVTMDNDDAGFDAQQTVGLRDEDGIQRGGRIGYHIPGSYIIFAESWMVAKMCAVRLVKAGIAPRF